MNGADQGTRSRRIAGLLLGGLVGDALGLPAEGLRAARIARMWPGELKHRFVFGRGMMSDDTEHQFLTGQALLEAGEDVQKFRKALGRRLRWWLLAFPAGVGLATARALFKLWLGWPPARSGVYSAGNGPAMRSAVIGARFADEPERLRAVVAASTYLTHRDPRALTGAMAVAVASAALIRGEATASSLFPVWRELAPEDAEWQLALVMLEDHLSRHASVGEYASALGGRREVSGYIDRTVPVALYAWLRHCGDYAATLSELIRCGGDSDTVAAIAGALAGAEAGKGGIPEPWLAGIWEWPSSSKIMEELAARVADERCRTPVRYAVALVVPRNLLFLGVVLCHGFRRLLPPYGSLSMDSVWRRPDFRAAKIEPGGRTCGVGF